MRVLENVAAQTSALSRRGVLQTGLAGAFVLGFHLPARAANEPEQPPDSTQGKFAPNAFIRIDHSGQTTLVMPQAEMGQGVYTAIAMILPDELDVDFAKVALEHSPPSDKLYGNPLFGIHVTGNSNSIRAFWKSLRTAGATTRAMLIAAAAKQWGVDPASCSAANGGVSHAASGRTLGYGDLVDAATGVAVPQDPLLKDPKDFTLIGKPLKRIDTPNKTDGEVVYGIDAMLPGMKVATLAQSPVFGGKVAHVDDSAAKKVPGVQQVIVLDDFVAVVGNHMWAAKKGLDALVITWDEGPHAQLSSKDIWEQLRAASKTDGVVAKSVGDVAKGLSQGARFEGEYEVPFLAHATMEPMNCTVHLTPGACEVWIGTQVQTRVQSTAAQVADLPVDKVTVHNHLLGGGFGRRLEADMVASAVRIAQHVDGPVKVVWTREEDIQHDMYRPYFFDRISAGLDEKGMPVAWNHRFAGSSILARWLPPTFKNGLDPDTTDGAIDLVYALPNMHVEYLRVEPPGIPTAFWRSVGPSHNVFVTESFIDELAAATKQDAIAYRRALLDKAPRAKAVVELAAEKAGWGRPLPQGSGRGVALQFVFGSYMAQVAEVEVAKDGMVRVRRVVCAVDCGSVVNPDTVRAQVEGAIIFGITAALYGEITLKDGRVEQTNFDTYQMLRMNEAPAIEVHIVSSEESPGGMGEPGTSAIVPAVTNAIFAATGKRLRKLPVDTTALKQPV